MQPHEQRVVDERDELSTKVSALAKFTHTPIFKALPIAEEVLLIEQLIVMQSYLSILDLRIERF